MTMETTKAKLIIGAVDDEIDMLVSRLESSEQVALNRKKAFRGLLGGKTVLVAAAGVGAVNMGHGITSLMERFDIESVVMVGSAGAYHESGAVLGDVVVARFETYADLGLLSQEGWHPFDGPPMNLLVDVPESTHHFVLDYERSEQLLNVARQTGMSYAGSFITVNGVSGDEDTAHSRYQRFQALAETMEGAAGAHVCCLYDVPFLEVRGVSNHAGVRDKRAWDIPKACRVAQEVVLAAMDEGVL